LGGGLERRREIAPLRTFPDNVVFNKRLTVMKHPLETLTTAAGILLMAFISVLLLPAPSLGLVLAQKLLDTFHFQDLNQLYTVLFCLWFLLLGAIEFYVVRFIWRRWFSLA